MQVAHAPDIGLWDPRLRPCVCGQNAITDTCQTEIVEKLHKLFDIFVAEQQLGTDEVHVEGYRQLFGGQCGTNLTN